MIRLGASACLAVVVVAGGQATGGRVPQGPPFAFGGSAVHGPYVVTVAADGSVHVRGSEGLTRIGVTQLGSARIAALNRLALGVRFGRLHPVTHCSATASSATPSWIRVGAKKVIVYGTCLPGYQRLLEALKAAVRLYSSG